MRVATQDALARVVAEVEPGARLLRSWPLTGGISTAMTALEVAYRDGTRKRLVVRQAHLRPSDPTSSVPGEFRLLLVLRALGLPTPRPRRLDESGDVLDGPYAVFDYVEGAPRFVAEDVGATARVFARQLAVIHEIDGSRSELAHLPKQEEVVARVLAEPGDDLDDSLREGLIRRVLGHHWPLAGPARRSLLHGDFWPGNVLWVDDEIVAVIDWEDAAVGDPLADVGVTRLDLLWAYGPGAMNAFTEEYFARCAPHLTPLDRTALACWDLVAAGRPAGDLSSWAAGWVDLGRPDITRATMQAAQHWFVDEALAVLGAVEGSPAG